MPAAVISIQNISKQFGNLTVVDNLSLDIIDGEFLAILGPSGCGKTTLLRMLGGFETPSSGRMMMSEQDITALPPTHRPLNMVFQTYAVFPHMNVRDNVAYGLKLQKLAEGELRARVDDALNLVQMTNFATRMPDQLSGGQRQRVALARAIVMRPKVLLLDEPLSALDAKLREDMQNELVKLQHTLGITFIVVTHDQHEALSMATRIAVMKDGKILQLDTPQNLYDKPNCRFVADFIGRMNLLPCEATQTSDGQINIALFNNQQPITLPATAGSELPAAPHYLGIRPERLQWCESEPADSNLIAFPVQVQSTSYYGNEAILHCQVQNINANDNESPPLLMANCLGKNTIPENSNGWLTTPPAACVLLSDE